MDKTQIGNRMKDYESLQESKIMKRIPIIVRLDGRKFSNFTKGMEIPFDKNFRESMVEVTKYLVTETDAIIGYTQSDEISLILYTENKRNGSVIFDGRVQKIASVFSSLAATKFLIEMQKRFPDKVSGEKLPSFDCRVFGVPDKDEACNAILWRVNDCVKNSVAMVAQSQFTSEELLGVNTNKMQEMLITKKDINWNDFSSGEKQGVFVRKEKFEVKLEKEILEKIPLDSRPENDIVVRNRVVSIDDMPNFGKVKNKIDFIFNKQKPETDL
jgi:tRNA(His) guanylyltransferase